MSADIRFYALEVPSTVQGAPARYVVIRAVSLPDGPEAFRTYIKAARGRSVAQTTRPEAAQRFSKFLEAREAVRVAVEADRAAANHLGLHFREAFEGSPEPGGVALVAFVALRPPVVREAKPPRKRA